MSHEVPTNDREHAERELDSPPSSSVAYVRGLECVASHARLVLPVAGISAMIEYEVGAPPPLARPHIGGLGTHGGQLLVSLVVHAHHGPRATRRTAKGVLLRAGGGGPTLWALEIDRVRSFVDVATRPALGYSRHPSMPAFMTFRNLRDGRLAAWLDVTALLEPLVSAPAARESAA